MADVNECRKKGRREILYLEKCFLNFGECQNLWGFVNYADPYFTFPKTDLEL